MKKRYIKAIRDGVIFQFEDLTVAKNSGHKRSQFVERTKWGFEHSSFEESLNTPRWVKVISVGNECPNDIQPGMRVLVAALKWTTQLKLDGEPYWKTDFRQILAIDDTIKPNSL